MEAGTLDYAPPPARVQAPRWARIGRRVQLLLSGCSVAAFPGGGLVGELCVHFDRRPFRIEAVIAAGAVGEWGMLLAVPGFFLGMVLICMPSCGERYRVPIYVAIIACILAVLFVPSVSVA